MNVRLRRALEALAVFVVVVVVLATTAHSYGLGYDEPVYMSRMQEASAWLRLVAIDLGEAFSDRGITEYWDARSEQQPGFIKLWGALSTPPAASVLPVLSLIHI